MEESKKTDGHEDAAKSEAMERGKMQASIDAHGYEGRHGGGPQQGQGHQGESARLSDQGSQGRDMRGAEKHERGSHGGERRNEPNKGSDQG